MPKISDGEMRKVVSKAINAANLVFHEAGVDDLLIAELGCIDPNEARKNNFKAEIKTTLRCNCWDCTGGAGPCVCDGPACDLV